MNILFNSLLVTIALVFTTGCGSKKEVVNEVSSPDTDTLTAPLTIDQIDTVNYFAYFRNDTLIDESHKNWSTEEVNGVFAASVLTKKNRNFQLTEIPRKHLESADTTITQGFGVYVDPTSLPVKVGLKRGQIRYNYRMFEEQNKIWIQGELIHTTEQAKKVFKFNLYENYPESVQIEELDEQFIDEE